MAERRCFHKKIVESDPFYGLPVSVQSLYVHLNMAADDDGFVNCASSVAARFKTGKADLQRLVKERFLLKFGEVYVIKHWRISNSLKNDRSKAPSYPGIAAKIWVKPNRAYTDHEVPGCRTLLEIKTGIQNGIHSESKMESQKKRTEKKGTEENRTEPNRSPEEDFLTLVSEYPDVRWGSIQQAKEMFRMEICSPEEFEQAMTNLAAWKKSEQWTKEGGRFIPFLVNWLERGQWKYAPSEQWGVPGQRDLDEDELAAIARMFAEDGL